MAGDWIPARVDLSRRTEVLAIASESGRSRHEVVGLLVDFWGWASNETHDGLLKRLKLSDLCATVGADESFWLAVVSVGWLIVSGDGLRIPNADHWITKGAKARLSKTKRQKGWRERDVDVDANVDAHVDTEAPTEASTTGENRTVYTRSTEGADQKREPVEVSKAEPFARKIFKSIGYTGNNGGNLWGVAALLAAGKIPENWMADSASGTKNLKTKARDPPAYFYSIVDEHARKNGQSLESLLKSILIVPDWPKGPPDDPKPLVVTLPKDAGIPKRDPY